MYVFDFEVFMYDWLVVFKNIQTKEYTKIINDSEELKTFYNSNKKSIFFGYNNKHFDDIIFNAILTGVDPYGVTLLIFKNLPKYSINKLFKIEDHQIITFDLMQDILDMSLKEAEGYMGLSIEETTIPFNIERKLNEEEITEVLKYCTHDVDATEALIKHRQSYIESKMNLCKMFNLSLNCLNKTNAGLAGIILNARKKDYDDALRYDIPKEIIINNSKYQPCIDLYVGHDIDIHNKLKIDIAGVPHILAYGGIHGAIDNYEAHEEMWLIDASSFYPSIMIQYGFISRNLKDASKYEQIYNERLEAKRTKNKPKDKALKLTLNTTYGAMNSEYNSLYDPHMANSVCITGQLLLVDLIDKIEPYCKLIQSNTDGIIIAPRNKDKIQEELTKWEARTRINVEIKKCYDIWQKDVNNYIIKFENGDLKTVGACVTNTSVNPVNPIKHYGKARVLDIAVADYFTKMIPVEDTINNHNELINFQIITKTGPSYLKTFWRHKNGDIEVNKVNRVFATKHQGYGNLYKTKENPDKTIRKDSIASLPEHCYVDNNATMKIEYIDRDWYIKMAKERIKSFQGTQTIGDLWTVD